VFKIEKRKKVLIKRNWELYLFFSIPLAWFIIFRYVPMWGMQIAFRDYMIGDTFTSAVWVGFDNFKKYFKYYYFWELLRNTLSLTVYQLVIGFPIPIIFALALNTTYRTGLKKIVQFVTYMPYFISTVVLVGLMMQLMNPRIGIINNIIGLLGGTRKDFMADPDIFASIYVFSHVWQFFGWNSIIYLAVLTGIPPELHESAMIDGAGRFKRILYVDLPGIIPTMIVLLIMNVGQIMTVGFEKIFLMQNSLNLEVSQVISTYVYTVGLKGMPPEFSYGTAIDMFNSMINLILIVVVNKIAKTISETSLW
jgi:ABC-type polysaccharide transport system permease subunit